MTKTRGGYVMINLAHVELSDSAVTFAGLYQKLMAQLGKPIMLCNINIGGTEYQDCYVQPVFTENGFVMTVGDYTVTVASNSGVTAVSGIVGVDFTQIQEQIDAIPKVININLATSADPGELTDPMSPVTCTVQTGTYSGIFPGDVALVKLTISTGGSETYQGVALARKSGVSSYPNRCAVIGTLKNSPAFAGDSLLEVSLFVELRENSTPTITATHITLVKYTS